MAPVHTKKRRVEDEVRPKKKFKKAKRQTAYHSSSEDEGDDATNVPQASDAPRPRTKDDQTVELPATRLQHRPAPASKPERKSILKQAPPTQPANPEASDGSDEEGEIDVLEINTALNALQADDMGVQDEDAEGNDEPDLDADSNADEDLGSGSDVPSESEASFTSSQSTRSRKKRNDPDAFATSMSKILDTKLSTSKRADPVLSRSRSAAEANKQLADSKLEQKARQQIRAEKKQASEKGRVKDVLGLETEGVDTGAVMEEEKRLKKTAQRGVVKLFNAVRAAQVKAEEAMKRVREEGIVGAQKREERVNEMSKQGFLDLISSGGTKTAVAL